MTKYIWRDGDFRDTNTGEVMEIPHRAGLCVPAAIIPDIPDYRSPITGQVVSGRVQRREDLKRNDCVEIDPPRKREARTEKWAKRLGLPLRGR